MPGGRWALCDISEDRARERQKQILLNELNHRVKNTLATVQAITAQALKDSRSVAEARNSIESRLLALSAAHDLLTREGWEGANLSELVRRVLQPFGLADRGRHRFRVEGDDVWLTPRYTLSFSLVLHELATNAAKYGALSNETGYVTLSFRLHQGGNRLTVRWSEHGGPPVEKPSRKGFGTRLLLGGPSHELGGTAELDYAATGLTYEMTLPAPVPIDHSPAA